MTPNEQELLDWLAFQYISDELPDADRDEFEARLAIDQDAREAVARAIELGHTVAAVCAIDDVPSAGPRPTASLAHRQVTWWKQVAWVLTVTAASLAIILVGQMFDPAPHDIAPIAGPGEVSSELAAAWMETLDEFESAANERLAEDLDEQDEGLLVDGDDVAEVEAPDWMMVAVSAMHKNRDEK